MSSKASSPRNNQQKFDGLPVWSALTIFGAALITGLLISLNALQIGLGYLLCYAISALIVTLFVQARHIFTTVMSGPLMYVAFTIATSWLITSHLSAEGTSSFSTTSLITSIYPITQYFPWLFWVTLLCCLIGGGRIWLLNRQAKRSAAQEQRRRRQQRESDTSNRTTANRARNRTRRANSAGSITVQELLERNKNYPKR